MAGKILIVYDTLHGSTAEVAECIGQELTAAGEDVVVKRVTELVKLDGYRKVILGCPVVMGRWTAPMTQFLERHRDVLQTSRCALFTTCLANHWGLADEAGVIARYVQPVLEAFPEIQPVSVGVFTGVLDFDRYDSHTGAAMRGVISRTGGPETGRHDFRDWSVIRAWAASLPEILHSVTLKI
jgi:menaquinone-dependent protoporphyrinogen oxidase